MGGDYQLHEKSVAIHTGNYLYIRFCTSAFITAHSSFSAAHSFLVVQAPYRW